MQYRKQFLEVFLSQEETLALPVIYYADHKGVASDSFGQTLPSQQQGNLMQISEPQIDHPLAEDRAAIAVGGGISTQPLKSVIKN